MSNDQTDYEPETIEAETRDHALAKVVAEGDPEVFLVTLEKKAALAPRIRQAKETLMVALTYPGDWTIQGGKACLNSAGAERIGAAFGIKFRDVKWVKEVFTDAHGEAYRFLFTGKASLYDHEVYVQGTYSTRDKFLAYTNKDGWTPTEDINEGSIRTAAYHFFCGNGVKELLGLRGIPEEEYRRIMKGTGQDAAKSSTVERGKGTRGGSQATGDEKKHQKELAEACISIANAGQTVELDAEGKWSLCPLSDSDERKELDIAKDICIELSTFEGDKGTVKGRGAKTLTGKWLDSTLGKARTLLESL